MSLCDPGIQLTLGERRHPKIAAHAITCMASNSSLESVVAAQLVKETVYICDIDIVLRWNIFESRECCGR